MAPTESESRWGAKSAPVGGHRHLITYTVGSALAWGLSAAISISSDQWYWWPTIPLFAWAAVLALYLRGTQTPGAPAGGPAPRVVVVGGGMGGIAAVRALARAPVQVTAIDSRNYFLFQPLIYEVAGAILNVEDITHAIRGLLRRQRNAHFRLGSVLAVDFDRCELALDDGALIPYDYLILATGLRSNSERVPGAAAHALPLKTLEDALRIRNHLLRRLETAAAHPELIPAGALDIVIVGGGMTGVEVAAAFTEIYNHALRKEFRELDFAQAKITILEAGDELLPVFHSKLRRAAQRMLQTRGAEIRVGASVAEVGPASVKLADGSEIAAGTVVLATGVRPTALAEALGLAQTGGRLRVEPNLSIREHPEVFAVGDMAALPRPDGTLHPALAQFAIQGGRHAAREIVRQLESKPSRPFRYWNKGMTSMVGYNAAILESGRIRVSGRLAFLLWGVLHGFYVPGGRNRLSVSLSWIWTWATRRRAALLLMGEPLPPVEQPADVISERAKERVRR